MRDIEGKGGTGRREGGERGYPEARNYRVAKGRPTPLRLRQRYLFQFHGNRMNPPGRTRGGSYHSTGSRKRSSGVSKKQEGFPGTSVE